MKVAISQPTYLPWPGYFDLIDQVDRFVLLDNVQFEKQSWQQRNRIKTPTGLLWLTVPVVFRGRLSQHLKDVEIREGDFPQKHLRAIELNYRRAPFFKNYFPELESLLQSSPAGSRLVDLNVRLLEWFLRVLGIRTPLIRSSAMGLEGKRTGLLVNICQALGAELYLSPLGSAVYLLEEMPVFSEKRIGVAFQHYEHPEYGQLFPPFCPQASVLDLIFNQGDRSLEILRSGRRAPFSPEEVARQAGEETEVS